MSVFSLSALRKLNTKQMFLAYVGHDPNEEEQMMICEFHSVMKHLEQLEEINRKNPVLSVAEREMYQRMYQQIRYELLVCYDFEATILYCGDDGYVDLLENSFLKETDQVLMASLVPLSFYLGEDILHFSEIYTACPYTCLARINDRRFSYFDEKTQTCYAGPFLEQYSVSQKQKVEKWFGKVNDDEELSKCILKLYKRPKTISTEGISSFIES